MAKTQQETVESAFESDAILGRLVEAYGVKKPIELAGPMGAPPSTVKNWGARGGVPLRHLVRASLDTKRSLDWLVMGADSRNGAAIRSCAPELAVTLHVSEPAARGWLTGAEAAEDPSVKPDHARSGGSTAKPRGQFSVRDALLPAQDTGDVRPLVLTLESKGAGRQLDYEVIPRLCGRSHNGEHELVLDMVGELALTYEWLQRNLHHTTGNLASVQMLGDSMQPTLMDGETLIVDRGVRELSVDAIYVVHMLGQRLVKRMQRKFDGSVVIISDNQAYEREHVPRGRVNEIEVLGRMVWPRVR